MYSVENLELTLCGLYHRGIMAERGLSAREAAEPNEADELLDSLDLEAVLQTVRHHAQTPFAYACYSKKARIYEYRGAELFDQRATRLYRAVTEVSEGVVSIARSLELWLLEDMTLQTVACVSLVCGNGAYASEYREIKDHESCLWLNLEDLTAKLEEMCGPYFEGELPAYEL